MGKIKCFLVAVVILFCFTLQAVPIVESETTALTSQEEARQILLILKDAVERKDASKYMEYIHSQYSNISENGQRIGSDYATQYENLKSGVETLFSPLSDIRIEDISIKVSNLEIKILDERVVITYHCEGRSIFANNLRRLPYSWNEKRIMILVKENSKWQVIRGALFFDLFDKD